MGSTAQRIRLRDLRRLLLERFEGARVDDLGRSTPESHIGGTLVWDQFAGQSQLDRQRKLWSVLRDALSGDQLAEIGLIVTLTPYEAEAFASE